MPTVQPNPYRVAPSESRPIWWIRETDKVNPEIGDLLWGLYVLARNHLAAGVADTRYCEEFPLTFMQIEEEIERDLSLARAFCDSVAKHGDVKSRTYLPSVELLIRQLLFFRQTGREMASADWCVTRFYGDRKPSKQVAPLLPPRQIHGAVDLHFILCKKTNAYTIFWITATRSLTGR